MWTHLNCSHVCSCQSRLPFCLDNTCSGELQSFSAEVTGRKLIRSSSRVRQGWRGDASHLGELTQSWGCIQLITALGPKRLLQEVRESASDKCFAALLHHSSWSTVLKHWKRILNKELSSLKIMPRHFKISIIQISGFFFPFHFLFLMQLQWNCRGRPCVCYNKIEQFSSLGNWKDQKLLALQSSKT